MNEGQAISAYALDIHPSTDQVEQILSEMRDRNPVYAHVLRERLVRNRSTRQIWLELRKGKPDLSPRAGQILVANALGAFKTMFRKMAYADDQAPAGGDGRQSLVAF